MNTQIPIHNPDSTQKGLAALPKMFSTPILPHLITSTFRKVNMNTRQPYAVSPQAGKQHSAEGWGTGRAVARVPRVKGSGTSRAGQAAFANFARKGRMAHPTKVTRKWRRMTNKKERLHALAIGISASAVPAFVESRGHCINSLKNIVMVVSNEVCEFEKTKEAVHALENLGFKEELDRIKESKNKRAGIGKMRNRKYRKRRGVLFIYTGEEPRAFKNIQGVELMNLNDMDLTKICPGGSLGRLILWTEDAFSKIDSVFFDNQGMVRDLDVKDYSMVRSLVSSENVEDVFYSAEVQAICEVKEYEEENLVDRRPVAVSALNPYLECFTSKALI